MKRLKKTIYLRTCAAVALALALVRWAAPAAEWVSGRWASHEAPVETGVKTAEVAPADTAVSTRRWHPIGNVQSYSKCFPDVQDVQLVAARQNGVKPLRNRQEAHRRRDEVVYVGSNPYFVIDRNMTSSIPYLVPKASCLVGRIGRNFMDSLYVRGVPVHKIIVSSVMRTQEDVERLRKKNVNATEQSCHNYATTVDICYNRYHTVTPPGEEKRRTVRDDTLKWVLSQVLRDLREEGACYVKYEVKQGCFHLTVR